MMAIDMGGPFNKAAYLFGTSTLATADIAAGGSDVMAAVMIGGMVPPIAIALATTFFKNRFQPGGAQVRPGQLCHGAVLHHGRRHSLRRR